MRDRDRGRQRQRETESVREIGDKEMESSQEGKESINNMKYKYNALPVLYVFSKL